jgi:hypothetical protein
MEIRRIPLSVIALFLLGCCRHNNLLLGRVESPVGTHTVVVTDCYRISAPGPQRVETAAYHYMPCRDADVWIRAEELTVNRKSYGRLNPGDAILVDHGVVSIERKLKPRTAPSAP